VKAIKTLFVRAERESIRRTVRHFEGFPDDTADNPPFHGLHGSNDIDDPSVQQAQATAYTLTDKFSEWKEEDAKLALGTAASYSTAIRLLRESLGFSACVASIDYQTAEAIVRRISKIPTNATKRYPAKSLEDAAKEEEKADSPKWIAAKTQQGILTNLRAIFKYGTEVGMIGKNPFSAKTLDSLLSEPTSVTVLPFSDDNVQAIFSHPKFLKEREATDRDGKPACSRY